MLKIEVTQSTADDRRTITVTIMGDEPFPETPTKAIAGTAESENKESVWDILKRENWED